MSKIPISLKGADPAADPDFYDGPPDHPQRPPDHPVTGYLAVASGLLGVFSIAVLFVPLTLILCAIAMIKGQWSWAFGGLFLAMVGFMTSAILLGLVGLTALLMVIPWP